MYKLYCNLIRYPANPTDSLWYDITFDFGDNNEHRIKILDLSSNAIVSNDVITSGYTINNRNRSIQISIGTTTEDTPGVFNIGPIITFERRSLFSTGTKVTTTLVSNSNNTVVLSSDATIALRKLVGIENEPNVEVIFGNIHYTVDGSDPTYDSPIWDETIDHTFTAPYIIKASYFPGRNVTWKRKSNIAVITENSIVDLLSPVLSYNSEEEGINIINPNENDSVHTNFIYYNNISSNDLSIFYLSTFHNITTISWFIKAFNFKAYCFTSSNVSDIVTFDLNNIPAINVMHFAPVITINNNVMSLDCDEYLDNTNDNYNTNIRAYYTIDGTEPNTNSIQYTGPVSLTQATTMVRVIYYFYNVYSYIASMEVTWDEDPEYIDYGIPKIDLYGSENKPITSKILKNYVDIIINQNYNVIKILDSINYNLNEIETQYDANNIAEEKLNRRFAGNSILIYTDECISGIVNINVEKPINELDKYKVPYWDRGSWNFNYFRNNIIIAVNEDELKAQILELSYPEVARNELISRNLYQLKEANRQNNNRTDYADRSDNRSLIYGKYFIIRFIFDNDRRIKLDTLDTNINIQ